jgi:hypothetical protein
MLSPASWHSDLLVQTGLVWILASDLNFRGPFDQSLGLKFEFPEKESSRIFIKFLQSRQKQQQPTMVSNKQRPPSFDNLHQLSTMLEIKEDDVGLN